MSSKRYGMMREVEYDLMDEILLRVKGEFGTIRFLEVGVMGGDTTRGVYRKASELGCPVECAGVDFEAFRPTWAPSGHKFFPGDSMDAWRKMSGEFNFLLVDACHCINHVMVDFLNYSPFLVVGGYALFHDTGVVGKTQQQNEFPQSHSYAGQPPSVMGVRDGLKKLGLLDGRRGDWQTVKEVPAGEDGIMGMILFRKTDNM